MVKSNSNYTNDAEFINELLKSITNMTEDINKDVNIVTRV
jgi:hypothetical protein